MSDKRALTDPEHEKKEAYFCSVEPIALIDKILLHRQAHLISVP